MHTRQGIGPQDAFHILRMTNIINSYSVLTFLYFPLDIFFLILPSLFFPGKILGPVCHSISFSLILIDMPLNFSCPSIIWKLMFPVFKRYNSCALKIAITKGYEEPPTKKRREKIWEEIKRE
jgi:hypothetical protein